MIVFSITMNAIPEKQMEVFQTLLSMIKPTARTAGCISYGVFCDIEDKNRFSLLGKWKTRDDLDHHIASHQFSVLLGTKILLCEPLEIQIITVSHLEGIDAVHATRKKMSNMFPINVQNA